MEEDKDKTGWSEYGRLVLKELERMNNNYESLRKDFDEKFKDMNEKMANVHNTEKMAGEMKSWQEKVNDVWSPSQMKEVKDEVYKGKGRWTATIAIIAFVQVLVGIGIALIKFL